MGLLQSLLCNDDCISDCDSDCGEYCCENERRYNFEEYHATEMEVYRCVECCSINACPSTLLCNNCKCDAVKKQYDFQNCDEIYPKPSAPPFED